MCNTKQRIILLVVTFISFKLFGQTSTKKIYYPSGHIQFVEFTNKENVRILKYLENGKLCNESNLKNGQFFGPQIQYDSLGNKLTEKFVLGVDQIPYKYLSDSATDDKFIDVITCHEINYYSNGIME